jgi:hypothetical protein
MVNGFRSEGAGHGSLGAGWCRPPGPNSPHGHSSAARTGRSTSPPERFTMHLARLSRTPRRSQSRARAAPPFCFTTATSHQRDERSERRYRRPPRTLRWDLKRVRTDSRRIGDASRGISETSRRISETSRRISQTSRGMSEPSRRIGDASRRIGDASRRMSDTSRRMGDTSRGIGDPAAFHPFWFRSRQKRATFLPGWRP